MFILSMEAQALVNGFCSNPKTPILQNPKTLTSSKLLSSSNYFTQTQIHYGVYRRRKNRAVSLKCCIDSKEKIGASQKEAVVRPELKRKKLAVFVSGGGSNFRSIHEACVKGLIHGDISVLVTNKKDCGGAEYASNKNIPVILFPKTKDEPNAISATELVSLLRNFGINFILLAGYLKLIPTELVRAYPRSIINIHPSLLPAFGGKGYYGMKVHKAVIASGARYSGPTIHFVDECYDTGRILAQRVVPVLAHDTAEDLATRVLEQEHRLYVEVTVALCEERIIWREDGVPLIQSRENPSQYC